MSGSPVALVALYDTDSFPICTLHAVLKREGVDVRSVFFKRRNSEDNTMVRATGEEIDTLVELLVELEPRLVGLCVRSVMFQLAAEITGRLKERFETTVVWGGIHPTLRPEQCLEHADVVCVGEGEEALVELVRRIERGQRFDDVQNLRTANGHGIQPALRPLIEDLDSLPFPDYSSEGKLFVEGREATPHHHTPDGFMTSRGCPFGCTFCCNDALRRTFAGLGRYVRRRSVGNVIEELVAVRAAHGLERVTFWDDVFTFDARWVKEFAEAYRTTIGLPFNCYCHPKVTRKENLRLLRRAGLVHVGIGIQAGSEAIRNRFFERHDSDQEIVRAAEVLDRLGIAFHTDILMENPLEGEEERRATFELLLRLPKPFVVNTPALTHFPESKLTTLLLERGLIGPEDVEDVKQQSYSRWNQVLDVRRDLDTAFWGNIYFLTGLGAPAWLVRALSRSRLLRRHPGPLTRLLRWLALTTRGRSVIDLVTRLREWLRSRRRRECAAAG